MRSWKRNKLFVAISLVSLVVGIACTTLLMAFVIHEYNVENYNPNKNRILRLVQTLPFAQQVVEGTFIYGWNCSSNSISVSGNRVLLTYANIQGCKGKD